MAVPIEYRRPTRSATLLCVLGAIVLLHRCTVTHPLEYLSEGDGRTNSEAGTIDGSKDAPSETVDSESDAPSSKQARLFVMGGRAASDAGAVRTDAVRYADVADDGTLAWHTAPSLPSAMAFGAGAVSENSIFFLGGEDAIGQTNSAASLSMSPSDGSLGTWQLEPVKFTGPRFRFAAASFHEFLYVAGGANAGVFLGDVWVGTTNDTGAIAQWVAGPSFSPERQDHALVRDGSHLYLLGGASQNDGGVTTEVLFAEIDAQGMPGVWQSAGSSLAVANIAVSQGCGVASAGHIYWLGGLPTYDSVLVADANVDGTLGAFSALDDLAAGRQFHACTVVGSYLYVLGGLSGGGATDSVALYEIQANGSLLPKPAPGNLPEPLDSFAVAVWPAPD